MLCASAIHAESSASSPRAYAYPIDQVSRFVCVPADINDRGQIAGTNYLDSNGYHYVGFVTGPNGVGVKALSVNGLDASANAINSSGQVVGTALINAVDVIAFVTDTDGDHLRQVGPIGYSYAYGGGINDAGQVSGTFFNGAWSGFLTGHAGVGYKVLGTLGGLNTVATRVNSRGQVIGRSTVDGDVFTQETHAFVTGPDGEGMSDLMMPGYTYSDALGINDLGQVTGDQRWGVRGKRQQFVTEANGAKPRLSGTLGNPPSLWSEGTDINDKGVVVGNSIRGTRYGRALVTVGVPGANHLRNLNQYVENLPEGVELQDVARINNLGQIATRGTDGKCYIVCPNPGCSP